MSGTQVSSFYPVNQLLQDNAQQITNYYAPKRNELLIQKGQQEVNAQEMEFASRAALGLLNLPDEAAMAAAYPGVVAEGQRYGFLKNAPAAFPGKARLQQIASFGISAKDQYALQGAAAAADAYGQSTGITGARGSGTTAAPGGGAATALAIPARGTGGPGAGATVPTEWLPYFYEASRETGIPVEMLIAQARQESSFNPNARGRAGEIGMFQIMPSTAQSPGFGLTGVDPASITGPENVRNNILFGARYLRARGGAGDPNNPAWQANALRSYNAGGDPNYVANVNRYRPGMSPSDPAAAVTTYTPGDATQPGRVQVAAVTPTTATDATTAPPAATTAGPAQPAATTTAQGATTAQQPPAAATAGLPVLDENFLSARDREQLRPLLEQARRGVIPLKQVQDEAQQRAQFNVQRQKDAATAAGQEEDRQIKREAAKREQAKFDAAQVKAGRAYPGDSPDAADMNILLEGTKPGGDPSTPEYANAYARQRTQKTDSGVSYERDMSMFTAPTWKPPGGGQGGRGYGDKPQTVGPDPEKLRQAEIQSAGLLHSLEAFRKASKDASTWERTQTVAGQPTPLSTAWTNAALLAKGEALFQLGVLSGPDLDILRRALADPSTFGGWMASNDTIDKQIDLLEGVINAGLERHRNYGKPPATAGSGASGASTAAPPLEQRKVGAVYQTPKGPMKWTGTGWLPAGE